MTEPANIEVKGGAGCLFFFGCLIISICVGNIYDAVHGWLCLGATLIVWAAFGAIAEMRR